MRLPRKALIVAGILAGTALLIIAGHLRQAGRIQDRFNIACHTEGEVNARCPAAFSSVPHCAEEDGSDQWPHPCFWTDPDTGHLFYVIPDLPTMGSQPAEGS